MCNREKPCVTAPGTARAITRRIRSSGKALLLPVMKWNSTGVLARS
jgi:hypothetical protein